MNLLVIAMLLSVPIIAILAQTFLKAQSMNRETDKDKGKISKKQLDALLSSLAEINEENKLLRKRIENLEIIVAGSEWQEKLQLPENTSQKEIEALAKLLKKKN